MDIRIEPIDQLLYKVAVPMSTYEEPKPDNACLWPDTLFDELLYKTAVWFPN